MQPGIPISKKGNFDSEMNPLSGIPMAYITRNEGVERNNPLSMLFYFGTLVYIIVEESGIVITSAYKRSSEDPRDNLRLSFCRTESD